MTTIRMISQAGFKVGACSVCGGQAVLKWNDNELPEPGAIGDCCVGAVKKADSVLQLVYKYKGVVRPESK